MQWLRRPSQKRLEASYDQPTCPVHLIAKLMVDNKSRKGRVILFRAMLHLNDYILHSKWRKIQMTYVDAGRHESIGREGEIGVEVRVCVPGGVVTEAQGRIVSQKTEEIHKLLTAEVYRSDSERYKTTVLERELLLSCFEQPIFVEAIPNGYCPDICCEHRPWYIVTTAKGRIKIGWRKRVITIDWRDSVLTQTADELFPGEDTTKIDRLIHAWNYEKARYYIQQLMNAV